MKVNETMTYPGKLLCTASAAAFIAAASPALAEGTPAGEEITNTATLSYTVNGVGQADESASDTFYVDRKVNVAVAPVGASPNVTAGQTGVVREFSITNTSNAAVGFALSVAQDGAATFAVTNVQIWVDVNDNDVIDGGETAITFLDSIAIDDTQAVKVQFDVPTGVADGSASDIILTANAVESGSGGATEIVDSPGANTAGTGPTDIETVLADDAGETDSANAGDDSDKHTFTVDAATVSLTKTSLVISDPVNGTTSPYAIPGAIVEYCIVVANASGSTAAGVVITDDFSAQAANIAFVPDAYGAGIDVFANGDASCAGGTGVDKGYTAATTTVSHGLNDVVAGNSLSLRFRVEIQ